MLRKQYLLIQENLNIDWGNVSWTDLTIPLYSGLAASLVLQYRFGDNTPGVLERQADIWRTYYHPEKTSSHFVTQVQQLPVGEDFMVLITLSKYMSYSFHYASNLFVTNFQMTVNSTSGSF